MIRGWSEDKIVISHPPLRRPYSSDLGDDFVLKNTTVALRLSPKMSRNAAPATKKSHSNFTKYCACHEKWISWFIRVAYETSFTMRGASKVSLQPHQYCACHEKWISWLIRVAYETAFTMRGASKASLQPHQILRLPRKMNLMIDPRRIWIVIYNARSKQSQPLTSPNAPATKSISSRFQRKLRELLPQRRFEQIPKMIRPWSEDKIVISHPPLRRPYSSHLGDAFCMEKYNISRSGYLPKCHQMLRLPRKVTLQLHQILRLPRTMNLMIDPRHIWNVIYNARSKHSQPLTSPNTAPATKSVSSRFQRKLRELLPPIERRFEQIPKMIRPWSDHDPRIKSSSRTRRFGDLTRPILETILYWKI